MCVNRMWLLHAVCRHLYILQHHHPPSNKAKLLKQTRLGWTVVMLFDISESNEVGLNTIIDTDDPEVYVCVCVRACDKWIMEQTF